MSAPQSPVVAIVVGGGPAPGINAVIGAATIRATLEGATVLGVRDGFEWLMRGDVSRVEQLTIRAVSRIHFRGGSYLGISRANPSLLPDGVDEILASFERLRVTQLITIGGDGTASTAFALQRATDAVAVVHVPKTIDDDVPLPIYVDTFGYQTARHYGVEIVKNLMVDAKTTSKWFFVETAGRKAGHLALGIGKAAGATLTLIGEEFPDHVPLRSIVDILAGSIIKRLADGRSDGVAVIAEGIGAKIASRDLEGLHTAGFDPYGQVRVGEINIAETLRRQVTRRLQAFGLQVPIVAKNVGYELRCADPIPFDMEYARDLGACAATHVIAGGRGDMISVQGGRFVPIPLADVLDPDTGLVRMRMVDTTSTRYQIACRYMIRLRAEDLRDADECRRLAAVAGVSPAIFATEFRGAIPPDGLATASWNG